MTHPSTRAQPSTRCQGGFVEEHRATSTLPDGSPMDVVACVVGRVRPSGKLVELNEYIDPGPRACS